jgi:hypothetical protein
VRNAFSGTFLPANTKIGGTKMAKLTKKELAIINNFKDAAGIAFWEEDQGWSQMGVDKANKRLEAANSALEKMILELKKKATKEN